MRAPRSSSASKPGPLAKIALLEARILRALCSTSLVREEWKRFDHSLADHHWQESDHGVVYRALQEIRKRDRKTWREQLPAQATRMGFPDVDWSVYFVQQLGRPPANARTIAKMILKLRRLCDRRKESRT